MNKPLKIAFIGLGEHQVRAHLEHLQMIHGVQLVGAYDPDKNAFKPFPFLAKYKSEQSLLADPKINAVFIASPDKFHADQLLAAVLAKKHVFCEKPMAVTRKDMLKVCDALRIAKDEGLVISTCHPRRFDPPFISMKNELPNLLQMYGPLRHFDFSFWYHEVTDEWKKNERKLLSDHFGHEIDIMRFLLGESDIHITAIGDSYKFYETTGVVSGKYSFRFCGHRSLKEKVYKEAVRLDFERGSVFYNLNTGLAICLPDGNRYQVPKMNYSSRFFGTNLNFIRAIRGEEKLYLTEEDIYVNNWMSVVLSEEGHAVYRGPIPEV